MVAGQAHDICGDDFILDVFALMSTFFARFSVLVDFQCVQLFYTLRPYHPVCVKPIKPFIFSGRFRYSPVTGTSQLCIGLIAGGLIWVT